MPSFLLLLLFLLRITNQRIKALQKKRSNPNLKLRLSVEGGGCSGFQYTFNMEGNPPEEEDR